VYGNVKDSDQETVLKGVARIENLDSPQSYIQGLLERVKSQYMERTYGILPLLNMFLF